MPLTKIDYSKTVIYKIVSNDLNITETYVGSTTDFTRRKRQHKFSCNNINSKKYNIKLYQFIRLNGGWDSFSMVEIEKYICSDGNESRTRERYWFELLNAQLNTVCPGNFINSKKEYNKIYNENHKKEIKEYNKMYYQSNSDKLTEQNKIYHQKNKEQINEQRNVPYLCECGCTITKRNKSTHQKSQKHIKLILQLNNLNDELIII